MSQKRLRAATSFICSSCRANTSPFLTTTRTLNTTTSKPAPRQRHSSLDTNLARSSMAPRNRSQDVDFVGILGDSTMPSVHDARHLERLNAVRPHRLHVYSTKHNTHLTFTAPPVRKGKVEAQDVYKPPEPNGALMNFSTGNLGFKKGGRGSYDAGFQLASYLLKQIQERGLLRDIKAVEVVLRGFGQGRDAVTKALLGQEGRLIRSRITAVMDATRLQFGGCRPKNPRRLG